MYSYVLYYNMEKSGINAVSASLVVFSPMLLDLQILFSWWNELFAFCNLFVMSFSVALLLLIVLPRYVNSSTSSRISFSTVICGGDWTNYMVFVFFLFILRPIFMAFKNEVALLWNLVPSIFTFCKVLYFLAKITCYLRYCLYFHVT